MKNDKVKNIITIGASAGGLEAISRLVTTFQAEMDAAIFIVIHLSEYSKADVIKNILQKRTALLCVVPVDQQEIENSTIYLAPSDHHLLIDIGQMRVTKGAAENHWRPSIDTLFRSAATAYNACVTGIILTGLLDDGTSGMNAIKQCGGRCMVQSPEEAAFPDMPNSVLRAVTVDYNVAIAEMGSILNDLFTKAPCEEHNVPVEIKLEADIARRLTTEIEDIAKLGSFTPLTCPDCGGVMVKIDHDAVPRYRCYTGHTFTEKFLEVEQLRRIEESVWVSIRMMEERKNLLINLEAEANLRRGMVNEKRNLPAEEMQLHINALRATLQHLDRNDTSFTNK